MKDSLKRMPLIAVVALVAVLALGATAATAHDGGRGGGGGGGGRGAKGASSSALVTEAAKQLGVTRAALVAAIQKAAVARIDEAVQEEDIDADDAAVLKEDVADNLSHAMRIGRARTVATNLGVTTAKLNTEFRDARKALYLARIDDAVEDGRLDAEDAAELKADLEDADVPGYSPGRGFAFGFGFGR